MTTTAEKLARQLHRDDMSRDDEVPVSRVGAKAYAGWLQASRDAGDRDTRGALESVDPDEFAAAWDALVAPADFTVANIAGGDLRTFRLDADGQIPDSAIRHARGIGFGGPVFGGPAGDDAADQYEQIETDMHRYARW